MVKMRQKVLLENDIGYHVSNAVDDFEDSFPLEITNEVSFALFINQFLLIYERLCMCDNVILSIDKFYLEFGYFCLGLSFFAM